MKNTKHSNAGAIIGVFAILLVALAFRVGLLSLPFNACYNTPIMGTSGFAYYPTWSACSYPVPGVFKSFGNGTTGIPVWGVAGATSSPIFAYLAYPNYLPAICNTSCGSLQDPNSGSLITSPPGEIYIYYPINVTNTTQANLALKLNSAYFNESFGFFNIMSRSSFIALGYPALINATNKLIKLQTILPPPPPPPINWFQQILNSITAFIQSIIRNYFCIKGYTC